MPQPVEYFYVVPVGTVIAWHPPPKPPLPKGLAYCDGANGANPDSPFIGTATPNLINRFGLGVGGDVEPGPQGGNVTVNLCGWAGSGINTGPTQVSDRDNVQNNLIQGGGTTSSWHYTLTHGNEDWNDGNHHPDLADVQVLPPGWVALAYPIRIT